MTTLRFDAAASKLTIETRAVGMLAKLAHDLSIVAREVRAEAKASGDDVELALRVPVRSLAVDGVRKEGAVDRGVLSASDRATIEGKIRDEVLRASEVEVNARAKAGPLAAGSRDVDAEATLAVGRATTRARSRLAIEVTDGRARARGKVRVSLGSLGITPPKGPLGAFKVDDEVVIDLDLAFALEA